MIWPIQKNLKHIPSVRNPEWETILLSNLDERDYFFTAAAVRLWNINKEKGISVCDAPVWTLFQSDPLCRSGLCSYFFILNRQIDQFSNLFNRKRSRRINDL